MNIRERSCCSTHTPCYSSTVVGTAQTSTGLAELLAVFPWRLRLNITVVVLPSLLCCCAILIQCSGVPALATDHPYRLLAAADPPCQPLATGCTRQSIPPLRDRRLERHIHELVVRRHQATRSRTPVGRRSVEVEPPPSLNRFPW